MCTCRHIAQNLAFPTWNSLKAPNFWFKAMSNFDISTELKQNVADDHLLEVLVVTAMNSKM